MTKVRILLAAEAITFILAALIHFGALVPGYEHYQARIAESITAAVLLLGLSVSLADPGRTRLAGLAAQGFALLATSVGVLTIILGVGPATRPDVAYHVAIVVVLIVGLIVASRTQSRA